MEIQKVNILPNAMVKQLVKTYYDEKGNIYVSRFIDDVKKYNDEELQKQFIKEFLLLIFNGENIENIEKIVSYLKDSFNNTSLISFIASLQLEGTFETIDYVSKIGEEFSFNEEGIKSIIEETNGYEKSFFTALLHYYKKEYKEYEKLMKDLQEKGYKKAQAHYISYLFEQLEVSKNKEEIGQEIEKIARSINDHSLMGDYYIEIGDYENAEKEYKKGIKNNEIACFYLLAGLYDKLYKNTNNIGEKKYYQTEIEKIIKEFGSIENLSDEEIFYLNDIKGDYYLEYKKDEKTALNYFVISFELAKKLGKTEELVEIAKIVFYRLGKFIDVNHKAYIIQTMFDYDIGTALKMRIDDFKSKDDKLGYLGIALNSYVDFDIQDYLIEFLEDFNLEKVAELQKKGLFDIFDGNDLNIEKVVSLQEELQSKINLLNDIVIQLGENNEISEELHKQLKAQFSINISLDLDYLFKLNNDILEEFEQVTDLLNIFELKNRIVEHANQGNLLQFYDILSLFSLIEEKDEDIAKMGNYIQKIIEKYKINFPFANFAFYSFLRNKISSWLEGKSKEVLEEYLYNMEISYSKDKELEGNNANIPDVIIEFLYKILKYENFSEKDQNTIMMILGTYENENNEIIPYNNALLMNVINQSEGKELEINPNFYVANDTQYFISSNGKLVPIQNRKVLASNGKIKIEYPKKIK